MRFVARSQPVSEPEFLKMLILEPLYDIVGRLLPFEVMDATFMRRALVGLLLLTPMTAAAGVQVVTHRMAFFSDAISHSVFTGLALGILFAVHPHWTLPLFALLVGLGIVAVQRRTGLSADTVIGVFFSAAIAFGLAIISREPGLARELQRVIYGDILTLTDAEIMGTAVLLLVLTGFLIFGFNHLLYIGVNADLAQAHQVRVAAYQYAFAGLLALLVVLSVRAVGMLLVTAMLIVPAAAARNLSRSAGAMFWWAQVIAVSSAIAGLLISAQDTVRTATGATIVLIMSVWFAVGAIVAGLRRRGGG